MFLEFSGNKDKVVFFYVAVKYSLLISFSFIVPKNTVISSLAEPISFFSATH